MLQNHAHLEPDFIRLQKNAFRLVFVIEKCWIKVFIEIGMDCDILSSFTEDKTEVRDCFKKVYGRHQ